MIFNKTTHPIEIKKISVRLWGIRDEIESALKRRMKECEALGVPLFIEDIKRFYHLNHSPKNPDNVISMNPDKKEDGMASLMESIGDEVKADETKAPEEGENLKAAEELIKTQSEAGFETQKPNPILERPYQRQAPDLDKISYGFIFLSDITMENVLTFTKDQFLQGQSVVIEFLIPQNFMMTADVSYCHNYGRTSRIISSTKPDFRVQCRFSFAIVGERSSLRSFLKSIEPAVPNDKKKPKKAPEDDALGI